MPEAPNSSLKRENGELRDRLTPQGLAFVATHWPAPTAHDYGSSQNGSNSDRPSAGTPSLRRQAQTWAAPRVATGAYTRDKGDPARPRLSLEGQAALWPAPLSGDGKRGDRMADGKRGASLVETARNWPAPAAADQKDAPTIRSKLSLVGAARNWPAPHASDFRPGLPGRNDRPGSPRNLNDSVADWTLAQWPAPRATDGNKGGRERERDFGSLAARVTSWPAPTARDYRTPNSAASQAARNAGSSRGQQLQNFVEDLYRSTHPDPPTPPGPSSSSALRTSRRRLNPDFVDWLMGWPPGWTRASTDSGLRGTAWSRWLQHSRSALSALDWRTRMADDGQLALFPAPQPEAAD